MHSVAPPFTSPDRNAQILLINRPAGIPLPEDFRIETAPIPAIAEGQMLVRNIYLSVDPAQRGWAADTTNYAAPVPLGAPMRALGVGRITESKCAGFAVGEYVYGWVGWQDYAALSPGDVLTHFETPRVALSAYAGILGINGITAYLALHDNGRPRSGETLLVSTSAGSVGSVVGQLGRAIGCRTIGLTGDDAKAARCLERFGYDAAINYKTTDMGSALTGTAPAGIDIFFDNVGGTILDTVLRTMKVGGRVVQCGTASVPSWSPPPIGPRNEREVLTRRLHWSGFVIFDHVRRFDAVVDELATLVSAGSLVFDEHITSGIETAPDALRALYAGENEGKRLIFLG